VDRKAIIITIIALLYSGVVLLPGFFLHRTTTPELFILIDDNHYSSVYGPALRMVLGDNSSDLRVNYGVISTFSAALLAKVFAIETFASWIKLTQFFQVFFLFCAAISIWILERNRRLVILVIFAMAPSASTLHWNVITPNNSGYRFLGFALLPLALAILKKYDGLRGALVASLASTIFILWNIEVGLACSSALLYYIFVSEIANRRTVLGSFWLTSLAFTASLFFAAGLSMLLLGNAGKPSLLLAQFVNFAALGYNGRPFNQYTVFAVGFAFCASFLVIYCCLRVRDGLADRDLIARAALATANMVWFGYYAHHPFYYSLWINFFLLLATVGPLLQPRRAVWLCAIVLAITCDVAISRGNGFTTIKPNIEGVVLSDKVEYLRQRNDQIRSMQSHDLFFFVSGAFVTTLMTKRTNNWPIFDPFAEIYTKDDFEHLILYMNQRHPSLILIESDDSPLLDAPRRAFLHRVRDAIMPNFWLATTKDGLEFWSRK
jgi:hypothetical protein